MCDICVMERFYIAHRNVLRTMSCWLRIQLFSSILEHTGSGLLLRSTSESETRILPSRTTVCNTSPYLAATFSFLRTPRDTIASCSTSASSTGLPRFHVKLWKRRMNYSRRTFCHISSIKALIDKIKDCVKLTEVEITDICSIKLNFSHLKWENFGLFYFFLLTT